MKNKRMQIDELANDLREANGRFATWHDVAIFLFDKGYRKQHDVEIVREIFERIDGCINHEIELCWRVPCSERRRDCTMAKKLIDHLRELKRIYTEGKSNENISD